MRRSGLAVLMILAVLAGFKSRTQAAGNDTNLSPQDSSSSTLQLEDFERRIGPLVVKGRPFTVVLQMKRIVGPDSTAGRKFRETLVRFEIRDTGDTAVFARSFPYEIWGESFSETMYAWPRLLEGNEGSGILVSYGFVPTAPLCGSSWQVFGLFDGRLVPFSKPLAMYGELIDPNPAAEIMRTETEPDLQADVLRFRVWTGNFFVIVPARVDWMQALVRPAWRCGRMTAEGLKPLCRFRVEAERRRSGQDLTFVRMFHGPDEDGIARHIVVKQDSEVEFLEAEAELIWDEGEYGVGIDVSR
ncbi:MAG TPA: hypothetical protein VM118_01670, partial [Acidobacteriota bacterium]|nr:hypothetical protein [Acidobacteriota bacterium]